MAIVKLTLTDREADIVRHALMLYAEKGADGCTTECYEIRKHIIARQVVAADADAEEYSDERNGPDDYSDDAEALASAGMGTDEDYGYYGGDDGY